MFDERSYFTFSNLPTIATEASTVSHVVNRRTWREVGDDTLAVSRSASSATKGLMHFILSSSTVTSTRSPVSALLRHFKVVEPY